MQTTLKVWYKDGIAYDQSLNEIGEVYIDGIKASSDGLTKHLTVMINSSNMV